VTTPQAFDMLRQHGWAVAFPERTFATVDHIVPTSSQKRPFLDMMAEQMMSALEHNCLEAGIKLWAPDSENQGIVHVIGPELGLTQPGMTIACGDSHTRRTARSARSRSASAPRKCATCWPRSACRSTP
jgi:3-isopropylmalate/(R)-2-methylmalate dehydratase large subunit